MQTYICPDYKKLSKLNIWTKISVLIQISHRYPRSSNGNILVYFKKLPYNSGTVRFPEQGDVKIIFGPKVLTSKNAVVSNALKSATWCVFLHLILPLSPPPHYWPVFDESHDWSRSEQGAGPPRLRQCISETFNM